MSDYAYSEVNYKRPRYDQGVNGVDAKIVIMGNTGVGKTSLLYRYTQNKFEPKNTTSTTGAFFVTKKITVDGTKVRLQLWDTAGQERFRSMAPMYYRGANAALLLYDTTNLSSFQDIRGWLEELRRNCPPSLLIYIVGSKVDLVNQRVVSQDRVRLALSQWFPPPSPSPASTHPPATPTNQLAQVASTLSYIRPRFTSFTPSRINTSSPAPSTGKKTQDDGALVYPKTEGLRRANSAGWFNSSAFGGGSKAGSGASTPLPTSLARANSTNTQNTQVHSSGSSPSSKSSGLSGAPARRLNGYGNGDVDKPSSKFASRVEFPQLNGNSVANGYSHGLSSGFGLLNGNGYYNGNGADSNSGGSKSNSIAEEEAIEDEDEDEEEWGLRKAWRLYEVSAKSDQGVKQLFDALISSVMAKREAIERENELRKRDSVFLSSTVGAENEPGSTSYVPTPAWSKQADEEAARNRRSGWGSCCI